MKITEVNADPTPLTEEGISDYLIQGKTGEILPAIVEEARGSIPLNTEAGFRSLIPHVFLQKGVRLRLREGRYLPGDREGE